MDDMKLFELVAQISAKAGAEAAIEHMEKEREKIVRGRKTRQLRNTKLLLANYNALKEHRDKSIHNIEQAANAGKVGVMDVLKELDCKDEDGYIRSIKLSRIRTLIILTHVDEMLELYKIYCERSGKEEDVRRYRILESKFFAGKKTDEIAAEEHVDERTVQRDIKEACRKLGTMIFGVDAMTEMS